MDKIWVITGLCIASFTTGISKAQEKMQVAKPCSMAPSTSDPNSLQALSPWFIREEHQSLEQHQQAIAELESQAGVYGEQLAPALISLGLIHQEAGRHADAATKFERALQIIRINSSISNGKLLQPNHTMASSQRSFV